ncbi:ATP-binding cassette sub-family B member 6-like isoform X1 [Oratosquilla oratoria]|uniref:ATP-binding cassette sub-family B member 6-like isoform X1 n=1 Tax=Oratosquilla oratoria TaxID=337810 RepID=UPI003F776923
MLYCPPNVTFSEIWVNHGISHCFLDTVTTAVYAGFLLLAGMAQWLMYHRYATVTDQYLRPKSMFFGLQVFLTIMMMVIAVVRLILQGTVLDKHVLYGYMIVVCVCNIVCWPLSLRLVFLERNYLLPSVPARGHGIVLLVFWTLVFVSENLAFLNLQNESWWFDLSTLTDKLEFILFVLRYVGGCLLFVIGIKAPGISTLRDYVNFGGSINDPEITEQGIAGNQTTRQSSTWKNVWKKLRTLLPFLWPRKNCLLQLCVVLCFVLLLIARVANLYVPIYYKLIVDSLGGDGRTPEFCWQYVLVYVALKFLQGGGTGGMGFLNNMRSLLWISVQQFTSREIQVQLFSHLHSLSLRWHLGRKTGEVLRVMDRGTSSINSLLQYIIFSILPTIIDIVVAIVYFTAAFNYWFGVIVFITMGTYLAITIGVTEWRTKYRRSMNLADNEQRAKGVDSLLNFETVKYYGAEEYEVSRYRDAVLLYQVEEWKSNASLCFLNTLQNIVINGGLLTGSMLAAWMVARKEHTFTVGDYVLFATYIMQLYTPLNWFGTYYRMIQQNFIDMENMFDLLEETQEVRDSPDAQELALPQGKIEFREVSFHYVPEKPVLKNVSFVVEPGKTIAIVGPSGSGKSTIVRLLFRFYDTCSGNILLDDEDIKNFSQKSMRRSIGVVPQDTVLFNETIMYNIRYGRVTALDSDVIDAARRADIHEKILAFPDKYETKVGERGLKLSGGEKQRVAIARTLLKSPSFLLLDEATSALDTQTERNIQVALNTVSADRTVVIIAHRLSTIIHADTILVLQEGSIVERGRHDQLLGSGGIYANMWRQQLEANNNTNGTVDIEDEGVSGVEGEAEAEAEVEDDANTEDEAKVQEKDSASQQVQAQAEVHTESEEQPKETSKTDPATQQGQSSTKM